MKRLIATFAGLLLALGLLGSAPADAVSSQPASSHAATAQARKDRHITLHYKAAGTPMVRLSGKAEKFKNHKVLIQRQFGKKWRTITKAKTDKHYKYAKKVKVPANGKTYKFRVKTPKTKRYANSYSKVIGLYWT